MKEKKWFISDTMKTTLMDNHNEEVAVLQQDKNGVSVNNASKPIPSRTCTSTSPNIFDDIEINEPEPSEPEAIETEPNEPDQNESTNEPGYNTDNQNGSDKENGYDDDCRSRSSE